MKKIIKICKSNKGVSEVLGTVLLLGIAVAIFSVLYFIVLSEPFEASEPYPTIVAYVEGQNLIIEHRGGDELGINTRFNLTIGGKIIPIILKDDLDDINSDEKWNFGERVIKDINGSFSLTNYTAGVFGVDETNNRAIFSGDLNIFPENDIGVEIKVDNEEPRVGDYINITIIAHNYRGDINATGVTINFIIPEGLKYDSHVFITSDGLEYTNYTTSKYNYDNRTGIWEIDNIAIRDSVSLKIKVLVIGVGSREPTQLAMVLDGSGSISTTDWGIMRTGLANAIENSDVFPHDGSVELTIIQFGNPYPNKCKVEISPTIINTSNFEIIASTIRNLNQGKGGTPMAAGIYLTADTMRNSINFDPMKRQIINLVTDGKPTYWSNVDEYIGWGNGYTTNSTMLISTENARNYLINHLEMTEANDEFDSLAVGSGPDIEWLNSSIVWPQPGYIAPPFDKGPGWVTYISGWAEFESAISEMFRVQFSEIQNTVQLMGLDSKDPYSGNDIYTVKIVPTDN